MVALYFNSPTLGNRAFSGGYSDPAVVANRLKAKGRIIITVAVTADANDLKKISELASDGFSFLSNGTEEMQQGFCRGTPRLCEMS